MNIKTIISFVIISVFFAFLGFSQENENSNPLQLNFDSQNLGSYDKEQLIDEAGEIRWSLFDSRASIVNNPSAIDDKCLKVAYPKGTVGPQKNGVQFIKELPASNEYYLDYQVLFVDGFDFKQGGKLPGLTSGGSTFTGGQHPDNGEGWSARYMWVKKGEAIVYFYYVDMKSKYGDAVKLNVKFETGKWYRLTQRIKLNEDNLANGTMQIWVDGKEVVNKKDIRYRLWGKGQIDSFYFSTFHGGASADWAPKNDSSVLFDNIIVSKIKPSF